MSKYTDAVDRGLEGLQAVSTGACPGCPECMEHDRIEDPAEHRVAWEQGRTFDGDTHFSWSECGICGSRLGGNRERWHAILGKPDDDLKGHEILHFDDACTDCVMYLANGDEPDQWS